MPRADAKYRFLADYFTDVFYGVGHPFRVAGAVGQENPVKNPALNLFRGVSRRKHVELAPAATSCRRMLVFMP